jgi:flavin reductase (DIM6/NTAB) family NADH-FMN oxidoreductase RutF
MFMNDPRDHRLRYNPWKALVVPRPIGWISTQSTAGVNNLAPFSYFNSVADFPPMVMFAPIGPKPNGNGKDTYQNILQTQQFVVNLVNVDLAFAMNASSEHFDSDVDEFSIAGVTAAPCINVVPPRVAQAPVSLECVLVSCITLPTDKPPIQNNLVIGKVVGVHIDESIVTDGMVDISKYKPLARMGYFDYAVTETTFSIGRPDLNPTEVAAELKLILRKQNSAGL